MRFLTVFFLVCLSGGAVQAQSNISVITAKTFLPPGFSQPAAGDGKTDDTGVLQADINFALAHQKSLELENGTYHITSMLKIEVPAGSLSTGFRIFGDGGPNRIGSLASGGVAIVLDSSAVDSRAVLEVGHGMFRDMELENFSLVSLVPERRTEFGLWFGANGFSHVTVNNVEVSFAGTAFADVDDGTTTERNGESVDLNECGGNYCGNFYKNSFGQAYTHHITNCEASLIRGGTFIEVGQSMLGNNVDVFGCSCTFYGKGSGPSTFIKNDGVNGDINVWGGRVELCDTIIAYVGGSYNDLGQVNIQGVHFTDLRDGYPILNAQLNGVGNAQWTNSLVGCRFDGDNTKLGFKPALSILPVGADLSRTFFDRCVFFGFSNSISDLNLNSMGIVVSDCRSDRPTERRMRDIRSNAAGQSKDATSGL